LALSVDGCQQPQATEEKPITQQVLLNLPFNFPLMDARDPQNPTRLYLTLNKYGPNQSKIPFARARCRFVNLNLHKGNSSLDLLNEYAQPIVKVNFEAKLYDYVNNQAVPCYEYTTQTAPIPTNNPAMGFASVYAQPGVTTPSPMGGDPGFASVYAQGGAGGFGVPLGQTQGGFAFVAPQNAAPGVLSAGFPNVFPGAANAGGPDPAFQSVYAK
jgi:hypothetical protein